MLLHRLADRTGLTHTLTDALPTGHGNRWRDRSGVLIDAAIAIVLGARNLSEVERLGIHRTLAALDETLLARINKARAQARRHVWNLLTLRPGGFPTVQVAGKKLTGWTMVDMDTTRRTVRYTVGWAITAADEDAIASLPETAWQAALHQDATADPEYQVAELSGLNTRPGWPTGLRLIARRVRPSGRHTKTLTALEKRTEWKYSITATNINRMAGIGGSHQGQWLDALHRHHAVVENRVRCDKAMGLANLPSASWR